MAYPSEANVDAAIDTLLSVATEDKTRRKAQQLYRKVLEIATIVPQVEPTTYANFFADGGWTDDFNA